MIIYIYRNYSNSVRPVQNASMPVPVKLGLTLTQIFDMVSVNDFNCTKKEWVVALLDREKSDIDN